MRREGFADPATADPKTETSVDGSGVPLSQSADVRTVDEFFEIPEGAHPLRALRQQTLPPLILFVVLLGSWEIWGRGSSPITVFIPAPSAILADVVAFPRFYFDNTLITLYEAFLGLALSFVFALIPAILMAHSRFFERMLLPFFVMIKVTPVVALAPAIAVIIGFGMKPIVVMVVLITFFPIVINAVTGFRSVNEAAYEVMRSVNASPTEIFWKLRVPYSLPYLFASLKLGVSLAIIGAVVAEWFGGFKGLGTVILQAIHNLNMERLFGAIFVLAVIGVAFTALVGIVERRTLRWHESQSLV